jgi:hypothetical protein
VFAQINLWRDFATVRLANVGQAHRAQQYGVRIATGLQRFLRQRGSALLIFRRPR